MSAEQHNADGIQLDLDHRQTWVLHHAILDHIERHNPHEDPPNPTDFRLLEKLESGIKHFTAPELLRTRELCVAQSTSTDGAHRDIDAANQVIESIDDTLGTLA